MIAIIDYGMGNIHSVQKALQLYGAETIITNKPKDIQSADKVVLPGVGAFDDAMLELKKRGLISRIKGLIKNKKPLLGICLGMQLLFESSEEADESKGLGIFKGAVKKFEEKDKLKVPQIGWNQLTRISEKCPLLKNIAEGSYVYFCHSYYPTPKDKQAIAATCNYGKEFAAIVWKDNVYGVQFHPEKSQEIGLKILKNFVGFK